MMSSMSCSFCGSSLGTASSLLSIMSFRSSAGSESSSWIAEELRNLFLRSFLLVYLFNFPSTSFFLSPLLELPRSELTSSALDDEPEKRSLNIYDDASSLPLLSSRPDLVEICTFMMPYLGSSDETTEFRSSSSTKESMSSELSLISAVLGCDWLF